MIQHLIMEELQDLPLSGQLRPSKAGTPGSSLVTAVIPVM